MRRGRRKDLYKTERDSLEGPHEEAEIQCKALTRGKNLAFSEDTCLEKERVRSKVTPRKVGVGFKRRQEPRKVGVGLEVSLVGIYREKGGLTFAWIERKTPVLRLALQSKQSSLCGFHCSGDQWGGGPNGQIVSVKRAADGKRQRGRKIIDERREKYRAKNGSLRNTSTDSKKTTFVILINHTSAPIGKEIETPESKNVFTLSKFYLSLW